MEPSDLLNAAVEGGDRRALARLLRLVEDRRSGWERALGDAWKVSGNAHLIGLTGSPGSGKSTLTNGLISAWRALDREVGVVAVDPSSPFTGGALLGDRIRMQDHVGDAGVFVRSMSNRGRLGGVADATAGLVTVLDATGFDPVVVETVGVGQSEVDVIDHADTVVVVITPGSGDGVQADKAGVLEIADIFVINKADRPGAAEARRWLTASLEMGPEREWTPPIVDTVATEQTGVEELLDALDLHRRHLMGDEGYLRRRRQARAYVERAAAAEIRRRLDTSGLEDIIDQVVARTLDPWKAASLVGAGASPGAPPPSPHGYPGH
ncbi:MAG: methylmalonyl Co-A mutase-associated GTPase MeaB [Acidimicrobiia bacterium]